jgi:chromosome segregation ATPase
MSNLPENIQRVKAKIQQLFEHLEQQKVQRVQLEAETAALREKIQQLDNEKQLLANADGFSEERVVLEGLNQSLEEEKALLSAEVDVLMRKLASLETLKDTLEAERNNLLLEKEILINELEVLKEEQGQLQEKLASVELEQASVMGQLAEEKIKTSGLLQELDTTKFDKMELSEVNASLLQERDSLQKELSELNSVNAISSRVEVRENFLVSIEAEIEGLRRDLEQSNAEKHALQASLSLLVAEKIELSLENEQLAARAASLEVKASGRSDAMQENESGVSAVFGGPEALENEHAAVLAQEILGDSEKQQLLNAINILEKEKEELKTTINNLEERIKIVKLAKSLSETDEKTNQVKQRINELVREIEKCIALLNS